MDVPPLLPHRNKPLLSEKFYVHCHQKQPENATQSLHLTKHSYHLPISTGTHLHAESSKCYTPTFSLRASLRLPHIQVHSPHCEFCCYPCLQIVPLPASPTLRRKPRSTQPSENREQSEILQIQLLQPAHHLFQSITTHQHQ